jgi:hypothetical protein
MISARRQLGRLGAVAVGAVTALGMAAPATAFADYGGGAAHDVWQVEVSYNCNSPTSDWCTDPSTGQRELGGFWGWVEFDAATGQAPDARTGTGDGQFAGCGHAGAGGGGAGAGHVGIDVEAWHSAPAGPDDPNFDPSTTHYVFWVDHNELTVTGKGGQQTVDDDADFLGDTGFPMDQGHYAFHPAPGVNGSIQVAFRPGH